VTERLSGNQPNTAILVPTFVISAVANFTIPPSLPHRHRVMLTHYERDAALRVSFDRQSLSNVRRASTWASGSHVDRVPG
jgi:hypothetical protein